METIAAVSTAAPSGGRTTEPPPREYSAALFGEDRSRLQPWEYIEALLILRMMACGSLYKIVSVSVIESTLEPL